MIQKLNERYGDKVESDEGNQRGTTVSDKLLFSRASNLIEVKKS